MTSHAEQLAGLDKRLAGMRFDFGKVLKNIPLNKDVKVFVRVKPVRPAAPKLTACDLREALTGVRNSEAPQAETRVRVVESAATGFDNCEL
jgi:hypothetical protein